MTPSASRHKFGCVPGANFAYSVYPPGHNEVVSAETGPGISPGLLSSPTTREAMVRDVEFVIACTTLPQDADMETFARTLVEERLVACVSTQIQVRSVLSMARCY